MRKALNLAAWGVIAFAAYVVVGAIVGGCSDDRAWSVNPTEEIAIRPGERFPPGSGMERFYDRFKETACRITGQCDAPVRALSLDPTPEIEPYAMKWDGRLGPRICGWWVVTQGSMGVRWICVDEILNRSPWLRGRG